MVETVGKFVKIVACYLATHVLAKYYFNFVWMFVLDLAQLSKLLACWLMRSYLNNVPAETQLRVMIFAIVKFS